VYRKPVNNIIDFRYYIEYKQITAQLYLDFAHSGRTTHWHRLSPGQLRCSSGDSQLSHTSLLSPLEEYRRQLGRARRHFKKLRSRLIDAAANPREFRKQAIYFMQSSDVRLVAFAEQNRRQKPKRRLLPVQVLRSARSVNPRSASSEPVRTLLKEKSGGGCRPLMIFGPKNRTYQQIVKWILEIWGRKFDNHDMLVKGSTRRVTDALCEKIQSQRLKFVAELDVSAFFPSVSQKWLRDNLPLPKGVIDNIVMCQVKRITSNRITIKSLGNCCMGLPQGSILSPTVAKIVMSAVLGSCSEQICGVAYVDNICHAAATRRELDRKSSALKSAFSRHSAGNFALRDRQPSTSLRRGMDFLGFEIGFNTLGSIRTKPNTDNIEKLRKRLFYLHSDCTQGNEQRAVTKCRALIKGFCASFGLDDDQEAEYDGFWMFLEFRKDYLSYKTAWAAYRRRRGRWWMLSLLELAH